MDIEKYSKIAPQYYNNRIPSLLEKYLKNQCYSNILDCGCGDGSLLYSMNNNGHFQGKKIFTIDLSKIELK